MKKIALQICIVLLSTCAFAQNPRILNPPNSDPVRTADKDVTLTVTSIDKAYKISVDGKVLCSVEHANVTSAEKPFPCDDNYVLKGNTYVSFWNVIYAYFEIYEIGGDEPLADAKIKIGEIQAYWPVSIHKD